jgi:hypothetical protein
MTFNLKETDYLKAWAIFWVAATVGGIIIGAVAGFIVGFALGVLGVKLAAIKTICGGVGFLLSIPLSYVLFKYSIQNFLLPKISPPQSATPALDLAA